METEDTIVLEREVKCNFIGLRATFSKFDKLGYVRSILMHIKENRGETTPRRLASSLFASNVTLAEGLLAGCEVMGMVSSREGYDEWQYDITGEGEASLDLGVESRKSDGLLEIVYTDDPMLDEKYRILRIKKAKYLKDDVLSDRDITKGEVLFPSFGDGSPVIIHKISRSREVEHDPGYRIRLRWTLRSTGESELVLAEETPVKRDGEEIKKALMILGATPAMGLGDIQLLYQKLVLERHHDKDRSGKAGYAVEEIIGAYETVQKNFDFENNVPKLLESERRFDSPMEYKQVWDEILDESIFKNGVHRRRTFHSPFEWNPNRQRLLVDDYLFNAEMRKSMSFTTASTVKIANLGEFKFKPRKVRVFTKS